MKIILRKQLLLELLTVSYTHLDVYKRQAIASKSASKMYDLEIIAPEIQTINNNMTRFVLLTKVHPHLQNSKINKASLKFELDHKRGSLAAVLNVMSDCKLNLTKIQSLPKIETPWKYSFFVDVTFEDYQDLSLIHI